MRERLRRPRRSELEAAAEVAGVSLLAGAGGAALEWFIGVAIVGVYLVIVANFGRTKGGR